MAIITGPEGNGSSDDDDSHNSDNQQDNHSEQSPGPGGNDGENVGEGEESGEETEESIKDVIDNRLKELVESLLPGQPNTNNLFDIFQEILDIMYRVSDFTASIQEVENDNGEIEEIELNEEAVDDKIGFIVNDTNYVSLCLSFLTRNENENQILDENGNPILVDEGQQYKGLINEIEALLFGILWDCSSDTSGASALIGNEKFVIYLMKRVIQGVKMMNLTYQGLLQNVAGNIPLGAAQHEFLVITQRTEACLRILQNAVCDADDSMKLVNDYGTYFVDRYMKEAINIYLDYGYPILSQVGEDTLKDYFGIMTSQCEVLAQMIRNISCIPLGTAALLKVPRLREFVVKFCFLHTINNNAIIEDQTLPQEVAIVEDVSAPIRIACLSSLGNFAEVEDEKSKLLKDFPSLMINMKKFLKTTKTNDNQHHGEDDNDDDSDEEHSERMLGLSALSNISLDESCGAAMIKEDGFFEYLLDILEKKEHIEEKDFVIEILESLIYSDSETALKIKPEIVSILVRVYPSLKKRNLRVSVMKAITNLSCVSSDPKDFPRFPRLCEFPGLLDFLMDIIKNKQLDPDERHYAASILVNVAFDDSDNMLQPGEISIFSVDNFEKTEDDEELKNVNNIQYLWRSKKGFLNLLFYSILHEEDEDVKIEMLRVLRGFIWIPEISQVLMPTEMMGKILISLTKEKGNAIITQELAFIIHNAAVHTQNTNLEIIFPPIIQMLIDLIKSLQVKPKSKKKSKKYRYDDDINKQTKIVASMAVINILREKGINNHPYAKKNIDLEKVTLDILHGLEAWLEQEKNARGGPKHSEGMFIFSGNISASASTHTFEALMSNENNEAGKSLESNIKSKGDIHPRADDLDEEEYLTKKLKDDVNIEHVDEDESDDLSKEGDESNSYEQEEEHDDRADFWLAIDFLTTIQSLIMVAPNANAKGQIASHLIPLTGSILNVIKAAADKESKDIYDTPDLKLFLLSLSSLCNGPSDPIVKQMQSDLQFINSLKNLFMDRSDGWLLSTYPVLHAVLNSSS